MARRRGGPSIRRALRAPIDEEGESGIATRPAAAVVSAAGRFSAFGIDGVPGRPQTFTEIDGVVDCEHGEESRDQSPIRSRSSH